VQYTRDSLGRITQKVETIGGVTTTTVYGYDQAGRLTDVTVDGTLAAHYEYDGNGNRLSVTRPGIGMVSGTYDAQDRIVTYGALTYSYTANGDLQSTTSGAGATSYSYDIFGNLTSVTLPNGTQIEYVIDGQNRRIGKKVNGTLVQGFIYGSQLRPAAELDGAGNVVSRFIYGTRINVPDYMIKGGSSYRLLTDHLGSVRLVLDTASGTIAHRIDYDEFGQILQDTNPGFQPFGFDGGLYDPDTKLTRFGARDYDVFTGRWTTKDPIRFLARDPNLFGYVFNDPVALADPTGALIPQAVGGIIGGLVGGIAAARDPSAGGWDIAKGALIGAGMGVLSTIPIPGVNPLISGAAVGLLGDLAFQRIVQGRPLGCLDPISAVASTLTGGLGAGYGRVLRSTTVPGPLKPYEKTFAESLEAYLAGGFSGYFGPKTEKQLRQLSE
jgi:RHS repeat-associated protein